MNDTQRLDWLEDQTTGYGSGWIVRMSTTGRGFRLHETSSPLAKASPREAIDAAIKEAEEKE